MRGRSEGPEAKAHIESGLTHRPIALVVIRAQLELLCLLALRAGHGQGDITNLESIWRARNCLCCSGLDLDYIVVGLGGMQKEILRHLAVEAGFVLHRLRGRPVAEIVIPRQSSLAREMRWTRPHSVVFLEVSIGPVQPRLVWMTVLLSGSVDIHEHRAHERRLRTCEVVGAVRVEHRAI